MIKIYTKENLSDLNANEINSYQVSYTIPFIENSSNDLIANAETKMAILKSDNNCFPITINNTEYESSYICSPYNALITYSKEEIRKINNKFLEAILIGLTNLLASVLKLAKINRVVSVNNYLLSTNLFFDWDGNDIKNITNFLVKKFPNHAIMFRSLNSANNKELLNKFVQNNYELAPSRQVYIFNKKIKNYFKKQNTKWDLKLINKTEYKVISHKDILARDYPRIVELYNKLYLEKYSYNNPWFKESLIKNWHKNNLVTIYGLRNKEGILDGVIGIFEDRKTITAPLVGYNTSLKKELGLYRILMILALKYADDNNKIFHASSGASSFKSLRGAIDSIEYSAVYIEHVSIFRKIIWKIVLLILSSIGVTIIKKYKL